MMTTANQTPLIELRDVYKIYQMGDTEVHASDGVSLKIYKGEFVAIVGQSGSGKSTLMNIIGCLDVPTSGQYFLDGEDVSELTDDEQAEIRGKTLGFIFQQYNLIPKLNVLENVELSLLYAGVPAVILADEPTGALDSRTSREVLDFLQKLNDEGNTIVLITHDNSIAQEAKRVVRVADGKIIFDGPAREAFPRGD